MARSTRDQVGVDPGPEELVIAPEQPATEEPSRPDWLDQKFESVEAQAQAYAEAQRAMSQAVERQRQTEARLEELAVAQQQQPEPQQQDFSPQNAYQMWVNAVEEGDAMAQLGVLSYLNQQQIKQELAQFQPPQDNNSADQNAQVFAALVEQQAAASYGEEWESLKPEVGQLLQEYPHLLPDTGDLASTVQSLSLVADMVKAKRGATAQAAVDAGRHQKLMAQGITGNTGRSESQGQVDAGDYLAALMKKV